MFISISEADTADFSARDWRKYSPVVRRLLAAYEHRRHLFYISPGQLEEIATRCDLNDEDRRILEGSYAARIQDVAALFRKSLFRLEIDSRTQAPHIDVGPPYIVTMSNTDFLSFDVVGASGLYAENIGNDSEWYLFLAEVLAAELMLPSVRCSLEAAHAGGGGMVAHFPRFAAGRSRGFCVVDRDSHGDWEPLGRHASDTRANAIRSRIIANDAEDYSSLVPFIALKTTTFRNVSSSIPPSLIEWYYKHIDIKPAQIRIFEECFSGFPDLTGDQWVMWLGLNFEAPAPRADIEGAFTGRVRPRTLTRYLDAVDRLGPPRMPKGTTGTVLLEAERNPNSRRAIEAKLHQAAKSTEYRAAVISMIEPITHLGASFGGAVL